MEVKQFEDKNLAQFSYAILCEKEIVLIDPARDPQPYMAYAKANYANIVGIVETHSHADFVSSHIEIHKLTGAPVYVSAEMKAKFPHRLFDQGASIQVGKLSLEARNTPGHSYDSISVVLTDENNLSKAVFTGDTLFIGDCGRPDLREVEGSATVEKEKLAAKMYNSLRNELATLPDNTIVYPAHGSGSLCGKSLSDSKSSTIGQEKASNWSLKEMSEREFVKQLLSDQPFIPRYFPFDVEQNKTGAANFGESVSAIHVATPLSESEAKNLKQDILKVDSRDEKKFKALHLKGAINIMNGAKFETWLGSIVSPGEMFYLIAESEYELRELNKRIAKIGYEKFIEMGFTTNYGSSTMDLFNKDMLINHEQDFTIVDVRNRSEVKEKTIFKSSVHIPLPELRGRINEIPKGKSIVVHCAGGYRSAAGASILQKEIKNGIKIYDLGEDVKSFPQ